MKKTLATRLMATMVTVCMVMAMMLPASAAYKYTLTLDITDKNDISVTHTTGAVTTSDSLVDTLAEILGVKYDALNEEFGSVVLGAMVYHGMQAYEAGEAAWAEWVDEKAGLANGNAAAEELDFTAKIADFDTKISALEPNEDYVFTYEPEINPAYSGDTGYGNLYTFTLTLNRTYIVAGGGGGSTPSTPSTPEAKSYAVTVGAVENATVTASATTAKAGEKITVTVTVAEGYEIDTVTASGATVTDNGNGKYSFTMPEAAVAVTVTVKEKAAEPAVDENPVEKYADVPADSWYKNPVNYVLKKGLMTGFNATTFAPEAKMTRAMVAQIFYNMEGQPAVEGAAAFSDVAADAWYNNAIAWAAKAGISAGYGGGVFKPDNNITREEFVQLFLNYAKAKGIDVSKSADLTVFADHANISDWAKTALSWGVGAGLLGGKGGNNMDSAGNAVRAEAAQMIMNFCENIQK